MGPLYTTAANGYVSVTKQLIEARCNFDLQENNFTARQGHVTVTKQLLPAHLTSIFRQRMGAHVTPSFNQLFCDGSMPTLDSDEEQCCPILTRPRAPHVKQDSNQLMTSIVVLKLNS